MLADLFLFLCKAFCFFFILGEPVQIALTLDIASISSISESNMVSVLPPPSTCSAPFLCSLRIPIPAQNRTETYLEWQELETYPETQDSGRCL